MKVVFLSPAERDWADAVAFYEQQREGLGNLFSDEVFAAIEMIRLYPEGFQLITKITRKCLLCKFPYMVLYGVVDGVIVVSSVAHQHRHPRVYLR